MKRGITFLEALTILFIGLKLAGYVDWPWPQVFWPLLFELAAGFIALIIYVIIDGESKSPWWEKKPRIK